MADFLRDQLRFLAAETLCSAVVVALGVIITPATRFSVAFASAWELIAYKLLMILLVTLYFAVLSTLFHFIIVGSAWGFFKALLNRAIATGRSLFLPPLRLISRAIQRLDRPARALPVSFGPFFGFPAVFFSPKRVPYRLFALSCIQLE